MNASQNNVPQKRLEQECVSVYIHIGIYMYVYIYIHTCLSSYKHMVVSMNKEQNVHLKIL